MLRSRDSPVLNETANALFPVGLHSSKGTQTTEKEPSALMSGSDRVGGAGGRLRCPGRLGTGEPGR